MGRLLSKRLSMPIRVDYSLPRAHPFGIASKFVHRSYSLPGLMLRYSPAILALAALGFLSACTTVRDNDCPAASAIVDTAVQSVFAPGAPTDPSNLLYTLEISGVKSTCDSDKQAEKAESTVTISFRATRAPTGAAVHYEAPFFVAISQSDRILTKREFKVGFGFEPGQSETKFEQTIGSANLHAGDDHKTFDYAILVGLQLTKEQLQYNRATGRLNP
jgi:hypothetical protein